MKNKYYRKEIKIILFFMILFLFFLLFVFKKIIFSSSMDGRKKFENFVFQFEKSIPEKFNCELKSKLFDECLKQLPDEAFIDRVNKPPKIILYYEKGKAPLYSIENVYDEYKTFIRNYFNFLNDSLAFFIFAESKIREILNGYDIQFIITEKNNIYKLTKENENKELIFSTDKANKILKTIDVYFNGQKYINLFFKFKKAGTYLLPALISINLIEEKQKINIIFINYKIIK